MFGRVKEFIEGIPKAALFAIVIIVLLGAVWAWKKFSSRDKETEVVKGIQNADIFAQTIQQNLDHETMPLSAATPEYPTDVQKALGDFEEAQAVENHDEEDEFEPFPEE